MEALAKYEAQTDIAKIWANPQEIKQIVAPKLTNSEFLYFMGLSKATGMNPLTREIWAVKYGDYAAQIFIGRDGYRRKAEELEAYDGHTKGAIYENDEFLVENGVPHHKYRFTNRGRLIAGYCVVYVKGRKVPFLEVVELKEYYKPGKNGKPTTWDTMPATMIQKVAEAQALRGAFQGVFGGTYDESEAWDDQQKSPVQTQTHVPQKPQYSEAAFQAAHKKISDVLFELAYHPNHEAASIKKYLGVDSVSDCHDMDKLKAYYEHLDTKLKEEQAKAAQPQPIPQKELEGMLDTVNAYLPDQTEAFVNAADKKAYATCQNLFDRALKAQEERDGTE